jgi:co-chaperonin GroES (HSP10)
VTGKVYAVPQKIQFNRGAIKAINDSYTLVAKVGGEHKVVNGPLMRKINDLKKESCRFETDNELQVGDTVKFSYMAHLTAKENNAIFDTQEGKMYFIKYDDIFMTVDGNGQPKKMINGYILIDPDVVELKTENGMEYTEKAGLIIPQIGKDNRQRKGAKCMEGRVLLAARPLSCEGKPGGYFDLENYNEVSVDVNSGDRILFDGRIAQQLEHENHQAMSEKKLYMIQRKDILFMEKDNVGLFDDIGMDKLY